MSRPAAFIDRDGTINENVHHLHRVEDLQLIPGAGEAIARLNGAGFAVVVITNQSAIARGLLTEAGLADIHVELKRQLVLYDATVDAIYHCPHHPEYGDCVVCKCRKPSPFLIQQAASEHDLDLSQSFMIGDNLTDLEAGWNAGCRSAIVRTGYGERTISQADDKTQQRIDYIGDDLADVVNWILK